MRSDRFLMKPFSFPFISLVRSLTVILIILLSIFLYKNLGYYIGFLMYVSYLLQVIQFWSMQIRLLNIRKCYIIIYCLIVFDFPLAVKIQKNQQLSLKKKKYLNQKYIYLDITPIIFLYTLVLFNILFDESNFMCNSYVALCFLINFSRYNAITLIYHHNTDNFSIFQKITVFIFQQSYLQIQIFAFAYASSVETTSISYTILCSRIFIMLIIPLIIKQCNQTIPKYISKLASGQTTFQVSLLYYAIFIMQLEFSGFIFLMTPIINNYSSKMALILQQNVLYFYRYMQFLEMIIFYSLYFSLNLDNYLQIYDQNPIFCISILSSLIIYISVTFADILNITYCYLFSQKCLIIQVIQDQEIQSILKSESLVSPLQDFSNEGILSKFQKQLEKLERMRSMSLIVFNINHQFEYNQISQEVRLLIIKYILLSQQKTCIIVSQFNDFVMWKRSTNFVTFKMNNTLAKDLSNVLNELGQIPFKFLKFKFNQKMNKIDSLKLQNSLVKHIQSVQIQLKKNKFFFQQEVRHTYGLFKIIQKIQQKNISVQVQFIAFKKQYCKYLLNNPHQIFYDLYEKYE